MVSKFNILAALNLLSPAINSKELSSKAFKKPRYIAGFFIYNCITIDGKYVLLIPVDFISVDVCV